MDENNSFIFPTRQDGNEFIILMWPIVSFYFEKINRSQLQIYWMKYSYIYE